MTPVGDSRPGDQVFALVRVRGRISGRVHTAWVDHLYGPAGEHRWVNPLCGAPSGRAVTPDRDAPPCKSCARIIARRAAR